jgi:retinol dehydrogenase 12
MGSTLSLLSETYPPKPKSTTDDIPDLTGKVMIVTGGNTGIGKETVKVRFPIHTQSKTLPLSLHHDFTVQSSIMIVIHLLLSFTRTKRKSIARSQTKAEAAIEDLRQKTGKTAIWLKLDLADLKSIKAALEDFSAMFYSIMRMLIISLYSLNVLVTDILNTNSGVMGPNIEELTAQGYDLQFGTNVLGT